MDLLGSYPVKMNSGMVPIRGSLVAECVRVMQLRIEAGEWIDCLPGERRLAELLQVGRDTVRLALIELENQNWLESSTAGKRRKILRSPDPVAGSDIKSLRIGMLSPRCLERLSQPMLLEVDHIRRALAEKGGSFEVFAPSWHESRDPTRRLQDFIANERRGAWVLHRSSLPMQRWFANQGIPCLVRGTPFHGITLPFLDVDWQATARHAAGMLWRLGHRHVAIMTPPDRLRGVELAVQGAREIHESEFTITELAENGTATGIERIFGRAMRLQHRPTAIIAIRPRQVATLYGCATRAGMRVPDDLSLVSLAREPFLEYLLPEVTGYGIEPEIIAKQVLRRLEQLASGNINPSGNPWLVPDTIKGHSIAAPSG